MAKSTCLLVAVCWLRRSCLTLFGVLATGAWAHGQSLPVSDSSDILATDPAAFIQLLNDARPSPVTPETRQIVLKSLPLKLKARALNARDRAKLAAVDPVLRAVQRDAVYEIRVIGVPSATIAIDGRAVLLISERALGVLDADQLRAAVAHEAAHEYVWEEWQRADKRDDWKRLRELELVCDGIAVVILQQLGLETSSLIQGFEKLTYRNLLWLGSPPNPSRYPTLAERREFAREVAAWIAGARNSDGDYVLFQDTTAQTATPTRDRAPTPESKWSRVYIDDVYVRDAVVRSLDGAAEWLNAAKCQSLLSEFADQHGRPLHERLAALNMTLATYLGVLIFDDGEARPQCERSGILAFTAAGSRVVRVCGRAFARAWQREPLEGRAAIVHEMLHTLGLGENPPEPRFITYRVKELCW